MDPKRVQDALQFQRKLLQEIASLSRELKEASRYYPLQNPEAQNGFIKARSGLLVPETVEGPQVLVNEFRALLISSFEGLYKVLSERLDDPLFDFAERTLIDLVTKELFVELSPVFSATDRTRVATLYMLHHEYNYGSQAKYATLKQARKSFLTKADLANLGAGLNNYIGDVVLPQLIFPHKDLQFALIDQFSPDFKDKFVKALHNRVHANPLSINMSVGRFRPYATRMRRQTFLIYLGLQLLSYRIEGLGDENEDKWARPIESYKKNAHEIRTVFSWLSKNHQ